ncbi:MAG: hypothetical protein KBG72_17710, partial [Agrobacterium sp.]|nr:hypothetical protein [Agrobacterium sp.]
SVLTPGMDPSGDLRAVGIPASVVTAYLAARGIIVEKTTDFTIVNGGVKTGHGAEQQSATVAPA